MAVSGEQSLENCLIHIIDNENNKLHPITEARWKTICKAAIARKKSKLYQQSKHFKSILFRILFKILWRIIIRLEIHQTIH